MGGAGTIIIRNAMADLATLSVVQDNLPQAKRARLLEIIERGRATWTDHDTHFVIRSVAEAYDALC